MDDNFTCTKAALNKVTKSFVFFCDNIWHMAMGQKYQLPLPPPQKKKKQKKNGLL